MLHRKTQKVFNKIQPIEGPKMITYVTLLRFTEQGAKNLKNSTTRAAVFRIWMPKAESSAIGR